MESRLILSSVAEGAPDPLGVLLICFCLLACLLLFLHQFSASEGTLCPCSEVCTSDPQMILGCWHVGTAHKTRRLWGCQTC